MMTKKDFQIFADALASISNEEERENIISKLCPVFKSINWRFDEDRFREWIRRTRAGLSHRGLK